MKKSAYKIMIVVGEASGDAHAAKLVEALRRARPDIVFEFVGTTGSRLRELEVETIAKADDFAISGVPEVARSIPMFWKIFQQVKNAALEREVDAAILVDFPDFNLRLAKALKPKGIKIFYYISPQIWAWRKYRVRTMRKYVDLVLTILPFEKSWYRKHGVDHVKYVGHPLAGEVFPSQSRPEFARKHGLDSKKPIVALLGGSRGTEIRWILPVLIETACAMAKKDSNLQFVVPLAPTRRIDEFEQVLLESRKNGLALPSKLIPVQNETYDAIAAADVAAVTSGTATLETALLGTPLVVVYRNSKLNARVLGPFISVEHISLVNLIAEKSVAKELVQNDFTASALQKELFRLLKSQTNQEMKEELRAVAKSLGDGGASRLAAESILADLEAEG